MATYTLIGIMIVIIGMRLIRIGYEAGTLERQLPLSKLFVYIGVVILTIYDMYKNIGTITWGLSIVVAMSALFEIISNFWELKKCK